MDRRACLTSSRDSLLGSLPELSEERVGEGNAQQESEPIYYSQVRELTPAKLANLNKMGGKYGNSGDYKRKKNRSKKVPLTDSPAYESSSPNLPARHSNNNLQHSISHDNLISSFENTIQNVTSNLHYSSNNSPIHTLPRSFGSQAEANKFKNSLPTYLESSKAEHVPPIPPKGPSLKSYSSLPNRYRRFSCLINDTELSDPVELDQSNSNVGIISLSQLLLEVTLPVVVKIVKGYCVDEEYYDIETKRALTEGDQLLISNLCFEDCAKVYLTEDAKTISIPGDSECKYELMSTIQNFDNASSISIDDLIKIKCCSGRLRVLNGFIHDKVGEVQTNEIVSIVGFDNYSKSIVLKNHQNIEFIVANNIVKFSTHLSNPSKFQNHLSICKLPQRVKIRGDFYTGFMKQYLDGKVGFVEHYGKEDFLFCRELVNVEGALTPANSWVLPIDDEIWVEKMQEIKVIEHGYDVLIPDGDYDRVDRGNNMNPKQRFYEKEISDLKILKKRLEFKVSQVQRELRDTKGNAERTIGMLTQQNNHLGKKIQELKQNQSQCNPMLASAGNNTDLTNPPKSIIPKAKPITHRDVANMNTTKIIQLLNQLSLATYTETFEKERINGDFFLILEESDLIELNVSKRLDRKKILRVKELLTKGEDISNYLND